MVPQRYGYLLIDHWFHKYQQLCVGIKARSSRTVSPGLLEGEQGGLLPPSGADSSDLSWVVDDGTTKSLLLLWCSADSAAGAHSLLFPVLGLVLPLPQLAV